MQASFGIQFFLLKPTKLVTWFKEYCVVDRTSGELLIPLLSFFEQLKNNVENFEKQSSIKENANASNMPKNKLVDESMSKKRKGLRS